MLAELGNRSEARIKRKDRDRMRYADNMSLTRTAKYYGK